MNSAARLAPALFVVLWATGFIGARYAMPWAEPFTFLALRFAITLAIFIAVARMLGAPKPTARGRFDAMAAGALMHGVYLGGVFWAVRHGMSAGFSALIVGLQPLITALLAGVTIGERIGARHWAGLALGLAGVVVVLWPKLGAADGLPPVTLAAALIAVLAMSAGTVWQKQRLGGVDLLAGSVWQYAGATLLMAIGSIAFETREITVNGELVFAMAWLVLVLSVGAILLLMYLIREGSVSQVASLFYLVPAVTALMAWPLFGETLTPLQLGGMALAALGVALATRKAAQPPA